MKDAKAWLLGSLLAVVALVGLLVLDRPGRPANGVPAEPLVVFCAAGLKPPVESVATAYGREFGIPVQLQYGGSGTLLANIRVAEHGDLFLAADDSYLQIARSNGLLAESVPIARLTPVVAVARGNPRGVRGLADLSRVGVALANPEAAAIGKTTREALRRIGLWNDIEARVKVFKPTVNDVANDIKLGTVDAGIVWDATVRQYPELEAVEIPEFSANIQTVSIGVLRSSRQPTAALRFARYLGAPERGLKEFGNRGYTTVEGDAWTEVPEVVLFSGGVNRVALEPTLKRFEEREGALVTRVYNGCGILVSQMKSGQHPDAYFACDISFMRQVTHLFSPALNVSRTAVVLLVPAGNPRKLHSLGDLTQPGLRVGVANAEQSALGALTARLLSSQGLLERVMTNVRVQTPTADLLVAQMRSGSLDVVVVYQANTTQVGDAFSVVPLSEPEAMAIQPYAVRQNSRHRFLMERLQAALTTPESRNRFESAGFQWLATPSLAP